MTSTTDKLMLGVGVTVTAVWAASFIADIIVQGYNPSPYIHFAMMAVVGSLFGRKVFGKDEEK